jgi:glucose/arabinose dehydrogenase
MCAKAAFAIALLCMLLSAAACGSGSSGPGASGGAARVTLAPLIRGLDKPLGISVPGDGSGRLFIAEKAGMIKVFDGRFLLPTPFLDLTERVDDDADERGLLGVAFHPSYESNGLFYVHYTRAGATPDEQGDVVVAEYRVSSDPNIGDAASERILLVAEHSAVLGHNGGQLAFGPDGALYVAIGDGDLEDAPARNAQNLDVLVGKILRIRVDGGAGYTVPADNPFVGATAGADEIWAYGLRNPWRFSFDALTGDLYIGDVGQDLQEEVNVQFAADPGGRNYGWPYVEGTHCQPVERPCNDPAFTPPVLSYDHGAAGCAVTGGYVYRGPPSALDGAYVYGDFCTGTISAARLVDGAWTTAPLVDSGFAISAFGQGEDGRLYVVAFDHGTVLRIDPR